MTRAVRFVKIGRGVTENYFSRGEFVGETNNILFSVFYTASITAKYLEFSLHVLFKLGH